MIIINGYDGYDYDYGYDQYNDNNYYNQYGADDGSYNFNNNCITQQSNNNMECDDDVDMEDDWYDHNSIIHQQAK